MTEDPSVDISELRQRSVYLSAKIKALKDEIVKLRAEDVDVSGKLKETDDKKTPEMKLLKRRRLYLRMRPEEARREIQLALDEKKQLTSQLQPGAE